MLKWAVNSPRQSYLTKVDKMDIVNMADERSLNTLKISDDYLTSFGEVSERRKLKRKSSERLIHCRQSLQQHWQEKENQMTSTPLPLRYEQRYNEHDSTIYKQDSLKDLSNIILETCSVSPKHCPTKYHKALKTPEPLARSNMPNHYASTLPTFEVEYSPCALVPGPVLALRGVGIADTYFEKPRYLTQEFKNAFCRIENAEEHTLQSNSTPVSKPEESTRHTRLEEEECSLSSSKMGDMTLERMIDAILESTRKEKKPPRNSKLFANPTPIMSPTYTRADDPASDLHEFWDRRKQKYFQRGTNFRNRTTRKIPFCEREVRSPVRIRIGAALDNKSLKASG